MARLGNLKCNKLLPGALIITALFGLVEMPHSSLEAVLLEKGACKPKDIEQALSIQKQYGGKLGNILLNMGFITQKQLIEGLSEYLSIPTLSECMEKPSPMQLQGLKPEFFIENGVYPVLESEQSLRVATTDPFKIEVFWLIEELAKKRVELCLATDDELRELKTSFESEMAINEDSASLIDLDDEIDKLKEIASEAPVIKLVNSILSKSIEMRSSDIHFESFKNHMRVRFRVDGVLRTLDFIPPSLKLAVITRLKLLAGMNIAENRLPQDGRISLRVSGKEVDIRASSVPTSFGESFVLRLLGKEDIKYSLESLGFYSDHLELIRKLVARPNGIFLTTGPTGSGKTTTLYSVLNELVNDTTKIITVEDPVEYELEGINQIHVRSDIGYTFARSLRSILRQDPDIIMIGEIRDPETAEIAIQASLTGHLVLSTLHTNSALSSITRLTDMGVEYFLLKASIIGVMAQRLVRTLCPSCSEPLGPREQEPISHRLEELRHFRPDLELAPRKPVGCPRCSHTGYIGRTVIAEVMPFDDKIQAEFLTDRNFDNPNRHGYRNMQQDGLLKFLEGRVSWDEILRVT